MNNRVAAFLVKAIRIALGFALLLMATSFFIQGGFSRYARYGMPSHADWRWLAIGLVLAGIGSFLVRPFWWRHLSRR